MRWARPVQFRSPGWDGPGLFAAVQLLQTTTAPCEATTVFDQTTSSTLEEAPPRSALPGITFGQATHTGRVRDANEDHHGAAPDIGFFVVADGVGGAPAGATASRLATAEMVRSLRATSNRGSFNALPAVRDDEDNPALSPRAEGETHGPRLIAAALGAHQMIRNFAARRGVLGSATTMAALWVTATHFHVANTGDSRVYRLTDEGLEQLTKDHTLIQEYKDNHGPPPSSWARHMENVVTQVLGGRSARIPAVNLASHALLQPEVFLLCTDGLTKMVEEADIAFVLRTAPSAQQAADVLVELANDWGGLDNTTCVVVYAEPLRT